MNVSTTRAHTFVFSGLGTLGDVAPMFTLASALVERGHTCHLLANDWLAAQAPAAGIQYTSVGRAQTNNVTTLERNLEDYVFPSYGPIREFFGQRAAELRGALVLSGDCHSAANVMAEAQGLATARLYVSPYNLRSVVLPPWSLRARFAGELGHTFAKYGVQRVYALWDRFPFLLSRLNELRRSVGLAAVESVRHSDAFVRAHVALFPDWFCARPPDWPEGLELVGFPLGAPRTSLPPELEAFLATRRAPLVFTPGTGVLDVEPFFREAQRACRELDMPGVFLSRQLAPWAPAYGPDIAALPYVDLAALLPRAALLVHHGGIGTTAQALAAGTPQIISPQVYDQPDNARHVSALGVGKLVERAELCGSALAAAARELLGSDSALLMARSLSQRMAGAAALTRTVAVLECIAERARAATSSIPRSA